MTKKSKLILGLASMLGVSAGATAVSGFAWFITTKSATVEVTNIGVYSTSSGLDVTLKECHKGVADAGSGSADVNLVGATVATTETIMTTSDNQTEITLSKYAKQITSITVASAAATGTLGTDANSNKITLSSPVATTGTAVTVEYLAYSALTDISSTDGQTFYKPTWTAGNPGLYATAMPTTTDGYVSFTLTLAASGSDALDIYLDHASITGAFSNTINNHAASIARVAFIEGSTTKLVAQNTVDATNNKGIDSTFTANYRPGGGTPYTQWDLSALSNVPATLTAFDPTNKATWSDGTRALSENYITHVAGNSSVDIKVNIWLEGTSGNESNNASGEFAQDIEKAMIKVNLPLIAFNHAAA